MESTRITASSDRCIQPAPVVGDITDFKTSVSLLSVLVGVDWWSQPESPLAVIGVSSQHQWLVMSPAFIRLSLSYQCWLGLIGGVNTNHR